MTSVEQLVGEFVDAWNAGERPDVIAFLDRAPASDRDELALQIEAWMDVAPTPSFSPATREVIAQEPALMAALEAAELTARPLGTRFSFLRQRAGLALGEVAGRLTNTLSINDFPRTVRYLEQLERDELDERRLSRRLLSSLADALRIDAALLAPTVGLAPVGQTFFRSDGDEATWSPAEISLLSRAALSSAPEATPMDELDRLFLGGPNA